MDRVRQAVDPRPEGGVEEGEMLYLVELTTIERVTIQAGSSQEAAERARQMAYDANLNNHHGEVTTVRVVPK